MKIKFGKALSLVLIKVIIFAGCINMCLSQTYADFNPDEMKEKRQSIENLIKKSRLKRDSLGIFIAQKNTVPLFNLNENQKMIPASITKLITAATTLIYFPPGSKLKTQILSTSPLILSKTEDGKNVLQGNLYLKGGGDPAFVSESMWYLVNTFLRNNIKKIEGDIIVDDTLFDQLRYDPSREKSRVDRAYDAPTGAMSFNWNSVNIFVRPAQNAGEYAQVIIDPENDYITLKGHIKTVAQGKKTNFSVERENGDQIVVSGQVALNQPEKVVFKNISHPDLWSGYNLKSFLKQRGIIVSGTIKIGKAPDPAVVLAESESKPIEDLITDMNKFSNNFVAEMLTKNISAARSRPGTIESGMNVLKDYLIGVGVDSQSFELTNPSGLTLDNKITAIGLWKVLEDMNKQFIYGPEFIKSLPIAGIDGTMKKRLKNSKAERWVRAKTGYLNGIVSLAGYIGLEEGTVVPFVMMYNDRKYGNIDESEIRELFDQILLKIKP